LTNQFTGIVVIDEAYIDFSEEESYALQAKKYSNLVILQSLSKAFGLAGIRLGIALSSPEIIRYLMKVKAPYNINQLTSQAALEAFEHTNHITQKIQTIKAERARLQHELEKIPVVRHIYKSDANFLLVEMNKAKEIHRKLAQKGIIVRYRGAEPGCSNCLRITVGAKNENNQLLQALKTIDL
jgi:histidinol-phosphate aminotransferase